MGGGTNMSNYTDNKFCFYCGSRLEPEARMEKPAGYDQSTGKPFYTFRKICPNWNTKEKHDVMWETRAAPNE